MEARTCRACGFRLVGKVRPLILLGALLLAGCTPPRQTPPPRVAEPRPHLPITRYVSPAPPAPAVSTAKPFEQTITLGQSVEGRPIQMTVLGAGGETTLILAAFHGNEPTSADVARELIRHLRENPQVYQGRRVAVVAVVNPDGLARGTRENAHGVDINRNFPAGNFPADPDRNYEGGPYPVSERETLAVLTALRQFRPARIVSIHSIRRGEHGNNYDGPARQLAAQMGRCNGYPVLASIGYPTPGSFGVWAGIDQQIPTVTLELPREADAGTCWRENREALLAAFRFQAGSPTQITGPVPLSRTGVGK